MKFKIPAFLKNTYFIIFILFIIWISLLDDKNIFFFQISKQKELNKLLQQKVYYLKEIENNKKSVNELKNNIHSVEKLAREKYLFKKENEDIYLIENGQ